MQDLLTDYFAANPLSFRTRNMRISESIYHRVLLLADLDGSGSVGMLVKQEQYVHKITAGSSMLCMNK